MPTDNTVRVRLDPETRRRIEALRADSNITNLTAAMRVIVALGLERAEKLEAAWRRAVTAEAMLEAKRTFDTSVRAALESAR